MKKTTKKQPPLEKGIRREIFADGSSIIHLPDGMMEVKDAGGVSNSIAGEGPVSYGAGGRG